MTRTEYDVVALGELLIDFTAQGAGADGYPLMAAHPGGAPANFLAAIARLGGRTALLSKVGADAFGTMLTGTLREVGVDTRGVVVAEDAFTTLAFVTLDARIAEKAGCSIPEIFAKGGEAAFRALEREVTAACGALSGKLLLTGGGVVKTPENYAALHQNGRIYQLLRPLELLPTDGRPLSQGADLAAMWAERAPLYERFRDAAIDNSGTVGQTAQAIWRDFCENSGH